MPITAEVRADESRGHTDGAVAVEVVGAHVTYRPPGRDPVGALSGMNLRVSFGEVVGVVGPSGCGKSTLLELVCGLQAPDAGAVKAEPAALMPQRDLLLPWLSAIDNAALAPSLRGLRKEPARRQARPLFSRFGLSGFEDARPAELSGGMRQRVAFLRTLLAGTPLLALDEPFAGLDALTRREMQDWLTEALALEPRTVVLVTHDVEEALILCDRVIVMGPRPGSAVAELSVPVSRPRRRGDPALVRLREQAESALGVGR
jgi:NitT/TauT family transport system ATP-binding protein